MKKYIFLALILVIIFTAPIGLNATYNDVTLTTDTVISVNSLSLTVSGSSASIESIVVNSTNFDVTLQSGSNFKVVSANKATLSTSATAVVLTSSTCTASESTLTLSGGNQVTVTITPSATECDVGISAAGGSGGGGGGGGGGSVTTTSSQTQTTLAENTTTKTITTVSEFTQSSSASSLTQGQINSIIGLLKAFGAEQSIIDNVLASLTGGGSSTVTTTQTSGATGVSAVFTKGFAKGASHPDIKRLQQLLNSDPDTMIAKSGVGSPGNETDYFGSLTEKAVQKFQMKHGVVSSSSDPGYGYLGPKTRAKLNQVFGQ